MKIALILGMNLFFILLSLQTNAQTITEVDMLTCGETYSDIDGNEYPTVRIGNQCWMQKNLETSKLRDGTPIPEVQDGTLWTNLNRFTVGGWSYYNNDPEMGEIYGKIYVNWTAQKELLCPAGFRVPTEDDFDFLAYFLGGSDVAGGALKATGTELWLPPNASASNSSGFSALPGGQRSDGEPFYGIGEYIYFLTTDLRAYRVSYDTDDVTDHVSNDQGGYVRCMFDVIEENSYYDLRPGVERFFDSITGFEPKTFDPNKDYYAAREKVLRVVEIDGKAWSEVEWTVYHGDWNPIYNFGTPVTKPKQLYTTATSVIEYLRVEGTKLVQWTEIGEKVVFDFDIKVGDNIYQKTSPYVDLNATALDVNTSGSKNGTIRYEFEVEFGHDRKPTKIKFGDSSSYRVPAEWELKSEIMPDLRLLIHPNYFPNIYKPVLPYMQVERIGVVFSPFNHRGLYMKGFTDFNLQYIVYPTYGQSVYNFASTPINKAWECGDEIKDIEGNRYRTVLVGTQCWMADNLTTSRYKNGTIIQVLREFDEWTNPTASGNWVHYNNNSTLEEKFGKLYNVYAAINGNGLCPADWRVPDLDDWNTMRNYLLDAYPDGIVHHVDDRSQWGGTPFNIDIYSGFNAVPSGNRLGSNGFFTDAGNRALYWTTTQSSEWNNNYVLIDTQNRIGTSEASRTAGKAIRCIYEEGFEVSVDDENSLPERIELDQNYPNPFNPTTSISYSIPEVMEVVLEVFSLTGQRVAVLENGVKSPGRHTVTFNANVLSSGIYYYRLSTQTGAVTQKMLLIK